MSFEIPVREPEDFEHERASIVAMCELDEEGFAEIKARIWARIVEELMTFHTE